VQTFDKIPDGLQLIYFADPALLSERAKLLGINIKFHDWAQSGKFVPGEMNVFPVNLQIKSQPGELNPANAIYVIETLQTALDQCTSGMVDALVTGPVHKGIINEAGIPFSGHTEWLADNTNTDKVVMMLCCGDLRVALVTTHLPLRAVADAINRPDLKSVIQIVMAELAGKFGFQKPKLLVCGLNPHAGENGHLGTEEQDIIAPVLKELVEAGLDIEGPIPADTAFTRQRLKQVDAVLAMYHDQGLPVLKHQGFGEAVNITLGLPIIRTSVDHGTALDLAGTGQADAGSFLSAIQCAQDVIRRQRV